MDKTGDNVLKFSDGRTITWSENTEQKEFTSLLSGPARFPVIDGFYPFFKVKWVKFTDIRDIYG